MNVGDQIKAINQLIIQEKQQIVFRGDKAFSEKYTILAGELAQLKDLLLKHGDAFEPEGLSPSLSKRSTSDEPVSFVRKSDSLSFLKNLNKNNTVPLTNNNLSVVSSTLSP